MSATCVRCGAPTDATVCRPEALSLAESLRVAAGHAEDTEAVLTRQARYGAGSRGGSDEPLPVDLTAAARYRAVENTIGTWARLISEETGGRIPPPVWPALNTTTIAALWLSRRTDDLRMHPAAGEAFADLGRACADLARLVDRPPDRELVGMCDCGKTLYAAHGRSYVTCPVPTCKLIWNVAESREILRRALDGKLVTASEAARLSQYLDTDRTQLQIRKLINAWSVRSLIVAHGEIDGEPAFRFGDISERLARTPRRTARVVDAA